MTPAFPIQPFAPFSSIYTFLIVPLSLPDEKARPESNASYIHGSDQRVCHMPGLEARTDPTQSATKQDARAGV